MGVTAIVGQPRTQLTITTVDTRETLLQNAFRRRRPLFEEDARCVAVQQGRADAGVVTIR